MKEVGTLLRAGGNLAPEDSKGACGQWEESDDEDPGEADAGPS